MITNLKIIMLSSFTTKQNILDQEQLETKNPQEKTSLYHHPNLKKPTIENLNLQNLTDAL